MEVGIVDTVSSLERANMMLHLSNKGNIEGRMVLDDIPANSTPLNEKLVQNATFDAQRILENLDLLDSENEDEGEIMLLAMILLQLHGVKLPSNLAALDAASKKKRQRTSPEQLAILEQIFQTDKMPNQQTRVQLADQLGMSSRRVQIWFQNKRAKVKRSSQKEHSTPSQSNSPADGNDSDSTRRNSLSSSSDSLSSPSSPVPESESSPTASSPTALVPQTYNLPPHKQQQTTTSVPTASNTYNNLKAPQISQSTSFTASQLFSLASFEQSQPLLLPNEYTAMRLQSMLKS